MLYVSFRLYICVETEDIVETSIHYLAFAPTTGNDPMPGSSDGSGKNLGFSSPCNSRILWMLSY